MGKGTSRHASIVNQIIRTMDPLLPKVIAQDSNNPNTITYICWAKQPGITQAQPYWSIIRIKSVATTPPTKDVFGIPQRDPTDITTATSEPIFSASLRESYTYDQDS